MSSERASGALVVVDMQNSFAKRGGVFYSEQAEEQIPAIQRAIRIARANRLPVVHTAGRWDSLDSLPYGIRSNRPRAVAGWDSQGGLKPGTWGHEFVVELRPAPEDHVVEKRGFYCPGLVPKLREISPHIHEVYVAGTTANNCVYAACLALFEADYAVRAIGECISSASEELRTPWLANVNSHLGRVISLAEFEAVLAQPAHA
jgi:nicotinamidase-related amidase